MLTDRSGSADAAPAADAALGKADRPPESGLRTVVLAYAAATTITAEGATLPAVVEPVVVLMFREQIRPYALQTLDYFRHEGFELKVISGDDPRTVPAIARTVGLYVAEGFDARTLPADPRLLDEVMENNKVFGRVSPTRRRTWWQHFSGAGTRSRRPETASMTCWP
ncbi:magnesium-transporting ATPase (P-type) [Pseudarthrobacter oxydans]|uniref:hypothetical protein n=1 Tax=Pseudarthrobacter oxydans TaxID=1671 RepID=UPI002788A601|nr:hypothetical protein [Pseudarthrobacter oxydans]MDP9984855.1 magnesium-transporting ATPase (P-type) [Pseudarthrobacter oxydans]